MSMFYHMAKKPRPAPYYAHVSMDPLLTPIGEKSSILAFTNWGLEEDFASASGGGWEEEEGAKRSEEEAQSLHFVASLSICSRTL